jgi:pimeloyl-ACP methyl ester carboxylesterase
MATRDIAARGLRFRAEIDGLEDGASVLLLHGFPQSRQSWRGQTPILAEAGFFCVAPDQRGYSPGARPADAAAYSLDNLVADGLAIMDAVGAQRFHLVGHDWGGQVAWSIAAAAPERIRSLSVLSRPHPAAFAAALKADPEQPKRSGHHRGLLEPGTAERLRANDFDGFRTMFAAQGVPSEAAELYIGVLRDPGALEAAIDWYRTAAGALRNPAAPRISAPTLYMWGDADATVGRMAAEATGAQVAGPYRFEVVAGGGHFLSDQHPDLVARLLLDHLSAHAV